ncbi:hypothetical protein F52700_891 [Fusarium sp. NRRL 52700]|nr:hypothetical protein F52700_891 [Fusarium sp. NRRL 52700]
MSSSSSSTQSTISGAVNHGCGGQAGGNGFGGTGETPFPSGTSQTTSHDFESRRSSPTASHFGTSQFNDSDVPRAPTGEALKQSSLDRFWIKDDGRRTLAARKLYMSPDQKVTQLVEAIARHSGYTVPQLSMASTMAKKNKAWKESRNSVLKIKIDPDFSHILSPEAIRTKCAKLGPPFDAIKAVQFPPLEMDRVLLIVGNDLDAREIRMHEERLKAIINAPGCAVFPEEFYISPADITRSHVDKMKTSRNSAYGDKHTRARLKKPKENLEFWRRETGLNIDRAYWKYGRLWFVLRNREEAQNAASGKMYSLEGLQTSFDSLDPKYVPKQCFQCQDFGHMAKQCPNEVRCGRCLENHNTSECKAKEDKYKCLFCNGAHPSYWLSLWRGRASWDTKGQEPEASGRSMSPEIPTDDRSPWSGFGIHEILREILSDQGAATPDESLLSHALGRGGDILVRLIEAFVRVAASDLGATSPANLVEHAPEPRRPSPSPSVLSTHSRLGTVTGGLSLANSPRSSARVLYDYANRSPSWQTPSPAWQTPSPESLYGSGLHSNGTSPERQVSVEPPFSSVSGLSDTDLFMDTFEEPAQQEVFELSADCPLGSIFELAADHPLYPEGHESSSVAQHVEDTCDMAPPGPAPDISLDSLPELSRDMIIGIISIPSTPIGTEGEVDWEFIPDTPPGLLTCAVTSDDPKPAEAACNPSPETSVARKRRRSSSSVTDQPSAASASQVSLEGSQQPLALPSCSPDVGCSSTMIPCSLPDPEAASQPSDGSPPAESSSVGSFSVRKRRWRSDEDLEFLTSPISGKKLRVDDSLVQDGGESDLAALSLSSPASMSLAVTSTVLSDGPSTFNSGGSLLSHSNPSTPPLRRSRRGIPPPFIPKSSTESSSSRSSSESSFITVDSSPDTSGQLESPATSTRDSSDQVAGDDSCPLAETSQSSLQIAPRDSLRTLRPRRGCTDDDEIAAQLEKDASQASPSDQELLEYEIGPESAAECEEDDGSDDEYSPGRKPKARSKPQAQFTRPTYVPHIALLVSSSSLRLIDSLANLEAYSSLSNWTKYLLTSLPAYQPTSLPTYPPACPSFSAQYQSERLRHLNMQPTDQEDTMIEHAMLKDTMTEHDMIEDHQYMDIDEEFSEVGDDYTGGGEIREDETLLKEITIWSVNLKGAPVRIRHLETALRLAPENARPLVLAIQDPPNRFAFHNIPGYNIFFSSDHPITKEQYPTWRNGASATGNKAATNAATSDGTQGATNPPDGTNPPTVEAEPLMHSVCFYVHKSIPTTSWRAIMDTGDNNGLVATLQILTVDRILTIHNVYDRNNRLDLNTLFERIDDTEGDAVLVGDFNLHHRSWSGHTRNETAKSRDFYEKVSSSNLKLLTTPGTITYSNSQDESIRSSTIDLTFAKQNIVPDVVHCQIHRAPGFQSDHRIIETKITRAIKTKVRTKPCLDRIKPKVFRDKLEEYLPHEIEPLSTREQIVSYISKLIQALRETIRMVAPVIEIGLQRKRQTILEKQLNDRVARVTDLQESPTITPAIQDRIKQL